MRFQSLLGRSVPAIARNRVSSGSARCEKPRFLATHNALRGVAALAVFAYHLHLDPLYRAVPGALTPLIDRGYLWVDFFFMLSGFVLSMAYLERLATGSGSEVTQFFRARIARVVPMHLAALAMLVALVLLFRPSRESLGGANFWTFLDGPDDGHLMLQAALVQIWHSPATLSWNVPAWSISAELHVYLLLPVIALAMARWPRLLPWALAAGAALIYAYMIVTRPRLDILDPLAVARCLAGFLLGVALERARGPMRPLLDRWAGRLQALALFGIVTVLAAPLPDGMAIPFLALLVIGTAGDRGPLAALLSGTIPQALGTLSYSIYLLNFPLLLAADLIWAPLHPASPFAARLWCLGLTLLLVLTASITFRTIEQPFRRTGRAAGVRPLQPHRA